MISDLDDTMIGNDASTAAFKVGTLIRPERTGAEQCYLESCLRVVQNWQVCRTWNPQSHGAKVPQYCRHAQGFRFSLWPGSIPYLGMGHAGQAKRHSKGTFGLLLIVEKSLEVFKDGKQAYRQVIRYKTNSDFILHCIPGMVGVRGGAARWAARLQHR